MKVVEVLIEDLSIEEREAVNAFLEHDGYEGFWQDGSTFKAYVNEKEFEVSALENLLRKIVTNPKFSYSILEGKNWNKEWEFNFRPVIIDDLLVIRAPFHTQTKNFDREVIIEPQMSFGTGHHNTTSLMAGYLCKLNLKGKNVLDMGCGTGVLAIIAAQQGARQVTAIDIEGNACENTRHNMHLNGVQNIDVIHGNASDIPEISYDIIVANINKNILIQDMDVFSRHLKEGAKLLLSGFFTTDEDEILQSTSENSLYLLERSRKDEWSMIAVEKKM